MSTSLELFHKIFFHSKTISFSISQTIIFCSKFPYIVKFRIFYLFLHFRNFSFFQNFEFQTVFSLCHFLIFSNITNHSILFKMFIIVPTFKISFKYWKILYLFLVLYISWNIPCFVHLTNIRCHFLWDSKTLPSNSYTQVLRMFSTPFKTILNFY